MDDLTALARKYGSDKYTHGYCPHYDTFFGPVRETVTDVLEIGVCGGDSISVWLDYFPNATVTGVDLPDTDPRWYGDTDKWPGGTRTRYFLLDAGNTDHL